MAAATVVMPSRPQLGHQAVLERVPQALDAAFGRRRVREDQLDPELGERSRELGRLALAGQLRRERLALVGRDLEDAAPR